MPTPAGQPSRVPMHSVRFARCQGGVAGDYPPNAWKNSGNVPSTPRPIRTREMTSARRVSYGLFLSARCRIAQATSHTRTPISTLPDSGPTASLHCNQSFSPSLASASVVNKPSAAAPIPPAMIAAAIGPSGLSWNWMRAKRSSATRGSVDSAMTPALLDDRGDLGDEGTKRARHGGEHERQHKQDHRGAPHPLVADQVGAVVHDDEGDHGGQDRADPGDVLLPLHAELVPALGRLIGQQLRPSAVGAHGPVPGIHDPGPG